MAWGVCGLVLIFGGPLLMLALGWCAADAAWGVMGLAALYVVGTLAAMACPWLWGEAVR